MDFLADNYSAIIAASLLKSRAPLLSHFTDSMPLSMRLSFRLVFLVLVVALVYVVATGRLIALIYRIQYSDEQLLAQQLNGEGCWFGFHRGSFCDFGWTYFKRAARNSEYNCRMQAAQCVAKWTKSPLNLLPSLKAAATAMPAEYDTGDGIIQYLCCFRGAIQAVEAPPKDNDLQGQADLLKLLACC